MPESLFSLPAPEAPAFPFPAGDSRGPAQPAPSPPRVMTSVYAARTAAVRVR